MTSNFTSVFQLALLILASPCLQRLQIHLPSAQTMAEQLGASRSRAYEVANLLGELIQLQQRSPGRPTKTQPPASPEDELELARNVIEYMARYPGCMVSGQHSFYSDGFRRFILLQMEPVSGQPALPLSTVASITGVPQETLRDWSSGPRSTSQPTEQPPSSSETEPQTLSPSEGVIDTILELWKRWQGSLSQLTNTLSSHHCIDLSVEQLKEILVLSGHQKGRQQKPNPDPEAIRGALEQFFAGAQSVTDGKNISIQVGAEVFHFSWQPSRRTVAVDAKTGAHTGFALREQEDGAGRIEALNHSRVTTGSDPVA